MSAHQAEFPIATMCRVLGISCSGYYAWRTRSPSQRARSNTALTETVRTIHAVSRGTYGAPRVHAELAANGVQVGKNRVARLMREASVAGISRRRFAITTVRDGARQAPDLVERRFTADAPNVLWPIFYTSRESTWHKSLILLDAGERFHESVVPRFQLI